MTQKIWFSLGMFVGLEGLGQYESEFTVAIPLNQPSGTRRTPILTKAEMDVAFSQSKPTGVVSFTLDPSALPFFNLANDLRIVGVGLTVERSPDDASPLQYASTFANAAPKPIVAVGQTPQFDANPPTNQVDSVRALQTPKMARLNATLISPEQTLAGGGPYQRPRVFLTNVRIQGGNSGDLEPVLTYDAACRNLSPYGKWSIRMDPNAIEYFQSDAKLTDSWIAGLILYLRLRSTAA